MPELTRAISTEILVAAGLPRSGWHQRLLRPLVWLPAYRFSRIAAGFDQRLALEGLTGAVRWILPQFVQQVCGVGAEHIPRDGPLIVATNHPGSYDGICILSLVGRDDLKIIVSDIPFLRQMHASSPHFIYASHNPHHRMAALRESVRHLQAGGALLLFASAQVDPDPALLPGASEALQKWSSSLPLMLRRVPATRLVVTIASGVLAPSCYFHPLARIRREQRLRQFLAEFLQVGQQVMLGRRFPLTPTIHFAAPVTGAQLGGETEAVRNAIIGRARELLREV